MFVLLTAGMLIITIASAMIIMPLGEFLIWIAPGLLNAIQGAVQSYLGMWVWNEMFVPLLMLRVWVLPGVLTIFLAAGALAAWIRPPRSVSLPLS
jgi:hypothetical protein